ncbi:uncharacterized protein ACBT57_023361 [Dama dama]
MRTASGPPSGPSAAGWRRSREPPGGLGGGGRRGGAESHLRGEGPGEERGARRRVTAGTGEGVAPGHRGSRDRRAKQARRGLLCPLGSSESGGPVLRSGERPSASHRLHVTAALGGRVHSGLLRPGAPTPARWDRRVRPAPRGTAVGCALVNHGLLPGPRWERVDLPLTCLRCAPPTAAIPAQVCAAHSGPRPEAEPRQRSSFPWARSTAPGRRSGPGSGSRDPVDVNLGPPSRPAAIVSVSASRHGIVNNPIPSNLKSEAKKAAKILREFTEITSRNGPDKIIPAHVIAKAKGLAILSVIKAGFLVTARGGSGIVLARLPDGKWSAPSAIGIAGLGGGFELGIEVSDLVIILNYDRAVEAFAKGGNLTLGGNLTVAVGPLGR